MYTLNKCGIAALAVILAGAIAHADTAAPAATFDTVSGAVQVQGAQTRAAAAGGAVQSGDTVHVGSGSTRLRTTDKALFELGGDTDFQVTDYDYPGSAVPSESRPPATAKYKLLRGTYRSVSGSIGKQPGDTYLVAAPEADIRVHGTDYTAQEGRGLLVTCHEGLVVVSNELGKVQLTAGEYVYVSNRHTRMKVGVIGDVYFNSLPPILINIQIQSPSPS